MNMRKVIVIILVFMRFYLFEVTICLAFAAARLHRVANHQKRFPRDAIAREQGVFYLT